MKRPSKDPESHFPIRPAGEVPPPGTAEPEGVEFFRRLAEELEPGVTVADILALPAEDLKTLMKNLQDNIVLTARITAEVEAEQVRRQAEIEAERAVESVTED